jgi:cytochrome c oxidase subunit 3
LSAQSQPFLAHQFDDLEQQKDTDTLGMWAFLSTEVMFFGGVFTAFSIYRINYTDQFAWAAEHYMNMPLGAINTGVLLCSSLTVALAVWAAHNGNPRLVAKLFAATILLALIFIGIKFTEYYLDYREGVFPGLRWDPADILHKATHDEQGRLLQHPFPVNLGKLRLFMTFYFIMTSIHALHMIIGIGVLSVVAWKAWKRRYTAQYYNPVEISGLYWHFVDLVWIFLFPTLYLLH